MRLTLRDKPEKVPPQMEPRRSGGGKTALVIVLALVSVVCLVYVVAGAIQFFLANPFGEIASALSSTQTPAPISTPAPTPRPDPQLRPGRVIYSYAFDTAQGWPIMMINDDFATIKRSVAEGKYRWEVTAKKSFFNLTTQATMLPGREETYQISMDVRVVEGPADAGYGIVFGSQAEGTFWLWAVNENGAGMLVEMVDGVWQTAAATYTGLPVRPGETNTLTVKISSFRINCYVNGWQAGSYSRLSSSTHSFISDRLSLSIGLNNPGDRATYEFDNYVVSVPETFDD